MQHDHYITSHKVIIILFLNMIVLRTTTYMSGKEINIYIHVRDSKLKKSIFFNVVCMKFDIPSAHT